MDGNRTGEAIIAAIEKIGRGVQGDLRGVTDGLSLLRWWAWTGRAAGGAGIDDPGTARLSHARSR
jgi:hypothetical protein